MHRRWSNTRKHRLIETEAHQCPPGFTSNKRLSSRLGWTSRSLKSLQKRKILEHPQPGGLEAEQVWEGQESPSTSFVIRISLSWLEFQSSQLCSADIPPASLTFTSHTQFIPFSAPEARWRDAKTLEFWLYNTKKEVCGVKRGEQ